MGFKVKLEIKINDPYTESSKETIRTAFAQFIQQYGASYSDCEVEITPDREIINLTQETNE
jgi:hypothetical protein